MKTINLISSGSLLFLLLTLTLPSYAQGWERHYGGNRALSIQTTPDANLLVSGHHYNLDNFTLKLILRKMTPTGTSLWAKEYFMLPLNTLVTSDNHILIAGNDAFNSQSSRIIKIDAQGNTIWEKIFYAIDILSGELVEADNGNYFLFHNRNNVPRLLKFGPQGNTLFNKSYPYDVHFIKRNVDGNLVLFEKDDSTTSYKMITINSVADTISTQNLDYPNIGNIVLMDDKGCALTSDTTLIRLDSTGNELWRKPYLPATLHKAKDGGFIAIRSYKRIELIKIDAQGDISWTRMYGRHYSSSSIRYQASAVMPTDDGFIGCGSVIDDTYSRPGRPPNTYYIQYIFRTDLLGKIPNQLSVQELKPAIAAKIYPNPTAAQLNIELEQQYEQINIQVSNVMGQLVQELNYQQQQQINLNLNGKAGIYFVHVQTNTGEQITFKVLKE